MVFTIFAKEKPMDRTKTPSFFWSIWCSQRREAMATLNLEALPPGPEPSWERPLPRHGVCKGGGEGSREGCRLLPKQSMYGIFPYIYHKNQPNVGKLIHTYGWYGLVAFRCAFRRISSTANNRHHTTETIGYNLSSANRAPVSFHYGETGAFEVSGQAFPGPLGARQLWDI